jgi:hypothetical protein
LTCLSISKEIPFKDQAAKQSIVHQVAQVTHGFVPTDLQSLCRQVVLALVKEEALQETQQAVATFSHFESALQFIKPSNFNEYQTKVSHRLVDIMYGVLILMFARKRYPTFDLKTCMA